MPLNFIAAFSLITTVAMNTFAEPLGNYASEATSGRSIIITTSTGQKIRITPYGPEMVRIQAAVSGKPFFADAKNELVVTHTWPGTLVSADQGGTVSITSGNVLIKIQKSPIRFAFCNSDGTPFLSENSTGLDISTRSNSAGFTYASGEHFTGGGHGCAHWGNLCDLVDRVDQTGRTGLNHSNVEQAPFQCPFVLSSNGYGFFVHSTFPVALNLASTNYGFSITSAFADNQMDFFVLKGDIPHLVDLYTQLTGRAYFPPVATFGISFSDKKTNEDGTQAMAIAKINQHRQAGYPIDGLIFDNNWKQTRCAGIGFSWYATTYPDPAAFAKYVKDSGISVMVDWNSCNTAQTTGWNSSWGIPGQAGTVPFPDLTNQAAVTWFQNKWMSIALDSTKPGSTWWLDEFEQLTPSAALLSDGITSRAEVSDQYIYRLSKCVATAWENYYKDTRRYFCMSRGMGVGGQRYGSHWTGDLLGDFQEMYPQIRMLQLSGLGGDPFMGHDNGGYKVNPTEEEYIKWAMAGGCFTPNWKPHGDGTNALGNGRWPLDRNANEQAAARLFMGLRYKMIPYNYTYAHLASTTGAPMARPMVWELQNDATAWTKENQYFWGKELIIAPNGVLGSPATQVWLPSGSWYNFWTDEKVDGPVTTSVPNNTNNSVGVFVRQGGIIPMSPPIKRGTKWWKKDTLDLHVYTGADGTFNLYDDDGISLKYQTGAFMTTALEFKNAGTVLNISGAQGTYAGAPANRLYRVYFHGVAAKLALKVNNAVVADYATEASLATAGVGQYYNSTTKIQTVYSGKFPVTENVAIGLITGNIPSGQLKPGAILQTRIVALNKTMLKIVVPASTPTKDLKCRMFDMSGRTLATILPSFENGSEAEFPLPSFRQGVQLLSVTSEGRTILSKLIR